MGSDVAGLLMKSRSLGSLWNSIVGILGGGLGGQLLATLGVMTDAGIGGQIAGSAVGGGLVMVLVGLLKKGTGVAFHPKFTAGTRFVYVRYTAATTPQPNPTAPTMVVRYQIPFGNIRVKANSATVLYTWPTRETSGHGSGTLQFDPGAVSTLFVPMPDDSAINASNLGVCCDMARAQGAPGSSDLGRLLSIDVDGPIPATPTVLAQGLRNPFGFSVDRGDSTTGAGRGDVWICDTGYADSGAIIKWIAGGGGVPNYGWPWSQVDGKVAWPGQPARQDGPCRFDMQCPEPIPPPIYSSYYLGFSDLSVFGLGNFWDAIVGGYAYRSSAIPSLTNQFVFATFGAFSHDPQVLHVNTTYPPLSPPTPTNISAQLGLAGWNANNWFISALGQDWDGELYVVRTDATNPGQLTGNGVVFRIEP